MTTQQISTATQPQIQKDSAAHKDNEQWKILLQEM